MIEHPRNSGIKIRERSNGSFLVDIPIKVSGDKRIRKTYLTLSKAKEYASRIFDQQKLAGKGILGLSEAERAEIQIGIQKLRNAQISITEAIEYAIPRLRARAYNRLLSDLIAEYIAWKSNEHNSGSISEITLNNIKTRSRIILEKIGNINIAEIDRDVIKNAFTGLKLAQRTKQNYFNHLGTLLKYATNEKYLERNPIETITDTDKRMIIGRKSRDISKVNILSVKDTQRLLETALANPYMGLLPCLVVQLFCGVRATESTRLTWYDIKYDCDSPYINISSKIAKGRYIRHSEDIPENALKWLSLCEKSQPFGFSDLKRYDNQLILLKQKCGFGKWIKRKGKEDKWVVREGMKNVLRHSFGSYHFELHKDAIRTSRAMGHKYGNDDLLFTHYRESIPRGEGDKYFNIVPRPSGDKVIPISSVA